MFFWVTAFLMALVINEAVKGKQKIFARVAVAALFLNMVLFHVGVYEKSVSNTISLIGLTILCVMILIRLHWLIRTNGKARG